jgi:hypothetical protein
MISIGQEAVVVIWDKWDYTINFGYNVTKITPTGQVIVTNKEGDTRRFNKHGYELGKKLHWEDRNMVHFDIDVLRKQDSIKKRTGYKVFIDEV